MPQPKPTIKVRMLSVGYSPALDAEVTVEAIEQMIADIDQLKQKNPGLLDIEFDGKVLIGTFDIAVLAKCTSQGLPFSIGSISEKK